ncbi:YaiI/YqxD family protein [Parvibaculum sp.]|uniref:YaiI/YqxD family protein n=1 Tax=Parvibaculum sp. TaxID=2024848 RepID=UPI0027321605|nr:YaiI/YqxD family protein [Parvibaculum sp.]MDP1625845.1 YaiI/YqxD family protein [Parvibaculum sp.]MDP2149208.1 YaiI/YqxD family protein [Parvibaculum sp.]MDP3330163.1 YaiI/YqxD family protein [Parvibaculum sp.]
MTEIYLDADACPVKEEAVRVAERHGITVHIVSNSGMRPTGHPLVKQVVVADGPDVADDWIAEHAGEGDIVVTGDIPLAARALAKGADAIGHDGRPFTQDSIGMALAMRDLMRELRETGQSKGGGPAFSKEDRSRFLRSLEDTVQAIRRRPPP